MIGSPVRLLSTVTVLLAALSTVAAAAAPPAPIAAAVADAARPARDRFRDERRKPAETLAFAGVTPGMKIAELIPGNGYYTRLLARTVRPGGRVYTLPFGEPRAAASKALSTEAAYDDITLVQGSPADLKLPEPVDMVWTAQNYHDIRAGRSVLNKAIFAALKPGGVYLVIDHAAKAGAGEEVLLTLHRIDEDVVKREVQAAGFALEAEGAFLRNPADDRSKMVFERELNRNTDQFVLRFRKPK